MSGESRRGSLPLLVEAVLACGVYALLAFGLLWPLFADPGYGLPDPHRAWLHGWHRPDHAEAEALAMLRDIKLDAWIYAWDWHALTHFPAQLFDANIFHPAPRALAYSEHALSKLLTAGAVFGVSGNPVLAYQIDLWLCFALSGGALYALLRHWNVSPAASFVAGFVYAFCPARLDMLYHSHLLGGQYLPLALLFLDRCLTGARHRDAAWFGLFLLLQLFSSYYLAYMSLATLSVVALGLVVFARSGIRLRGVVGATVAASIAALALAAFSLPYLETRAAGSFFDFGLVPQALVSRSNLSWRNYLVPPFALNDGSDLGAGGTFGYLGLLPVALSLACLWPARRALAPAARRAVVCALACVATGWVLGLGPLAEIGGWSLPLPYRAAMELVPGFNSMRVPGRFVLMLMLGFAVLVGLGTQRVAGRLASAAPNLGALAAGRALAASVVVALIALEYGLPSQSFRTLPVETADRTPEIYRALAERPPGPVLQIPFLGRSGSLCGEYQLQSTGHWYPLLNGSSGYNPRSFRFVHRLVRELPDAGALELLARGTGLRYVLVHGASLGPWLEPRWREPAGMQLVGSFGDDRLYELENPPAPDLLPSLRDCAMGADTCADLEKRVEEAAGQ